MFKIPNQPPIKITSSAVKQICKLLKNKNKFGLKIGLKKGGCAGMEYTMEFVDNSNKSDEIVIVDGARVIISPEAQMFLFGTEIDYHTSLLESGFRFNNPNVKEQCGCGESIKF